MEVCSSLGYYGSCRIFIGRIDMKNEQRFFVNRGGSNFLNKEGKKTVASLSCRIIFGKQG